MNDKKLTACIKVPEWYIDIAHSYQIGYCQLAIYGFVITGIELLEQWIIFVPEKEWF